MAFEQLINWFISNYEIVFGGSGILAGLIALYNILAKRREEAVNVAKYRMERLKDRYADYVLLSGYSYAMSEMLSKHVSFYDKVEIFISTLKFVQILQSIEKNGSFLLTNQESETILLQTVNSNRESIKCIFPKFVFYEFRSLNSSKPVHKIRSQICKPGTDYNKMFILFAKWLHDNRNIEEKNKIMSRADTIGDLMTFELNITHETWYNRKFNGSMFLGDNARKEISKYKIDSRRYRRKLRLNCEL